jgi:hypothetical protein
LIPLFDWLAGSIGFDKNPGQEESSFSIVTDLKEFNSLNVKISSRYYLGLYSYNQSNTYSGRIDYLKHFLGD